jgi:hypothetical protein
MITIKLNVVKLEKERFHRGEKGVYVDLVLFEKPNDFSDGYVVQSVSKEAHDRGERGPICGSWQEIKKKTDQTSERRPPAKPAPRPPADDDIPF